MGCDRAEVLAVQPDPPQPLAAQGAHGLVQRTVHPVVPPRVDYALTQLGATPHKTIQALVDWTEEHQHEVAAARTAYDTRAEATVS